MKLHILSDLHIEFVEFTPPSTDADVVVLAGDVGVGLGGLEWTARHFDDRPVIYVPGNHEYYGHDLSLIDRLKTTAPANVRVLDDDALVIDDVRFIGSTLWTDFCIDGEDKKHLSMTVAARLLTDFSRIRRGSRAFTPQDAADLHRESRAWIRASLAEPFDGRTVVVTHHLPSAMSIAPRYAGDSLNPAFASRLEPLIESGRPALWIHGHTHEPLDYRLHCTRVICSPRGYPRESTTGIFVPDLVVTL